MKKWVKYSLTLLALCAVFFSACYVPELIGLYRDSTYMGKMQEYQYDNTFSMYEQAEGKEENWNLMKRLQQSGCEIELEITSEPMSDWGLVHDHFLKELTSINDIYANTNQSDFIIQECELKYSLVEDREGSLGCYLVYLVGTQDLIAALIDKETYGIYYFETLVQEQLVLLTEQMTNFVSGYEDGVWMEEIYNQVFQKGKWGQEYEEGLQKYYNNMINIKKAYGEEISDSKKADYEVELLIVDKEVPVGFRCGFLGLSELIAEFDQDLGYGWTLSIEDFYSNSLKDWSDSSAVVK